MTTTRPTRFGRPHSSRHGFALVIALGLMAFILLLLISVSALVRVETQSAQTSINRLEAEQNANLGLLVAIGQLQKFTGPDASVTAENIALTGSFVSGGSPDSGSVEPDQSLTDHRWLGVWNNDTDGNGVVDDADNFRDPRPRLQTWLVSGNSASDPLKVEPDDPNIPNEMVWLVDEAVNTSNISGGHTAAETEKRVRVPKEPIESTQSLNSGAYAYWISDEGLKLNVSAEEDAINGSLNPTDKMLTSQRSGLQAVPDPENETISLETLLTIDKLPRISSTQDLDFISTRSDLDKHFFHRLTAYSKSLFTSARGNGLMGDLSRAMSLNESQFDSQFMDRVSPTTGFVFDPVLNPSSPSPSDPGGPDWRQLYSWANSLDNRLGADRYRMVLPSTTESGLYPLLTKVQFFNHVSISRTGVPRFWVFPAVVLWNPYDVDIDIPQTYVRVTEENDAVRPAADNWNGFGWLMSAVTESGLQRLLSPLSNPYNNNYQERFQRHAFRHDSIDKPYPLTFGLSSTIIPAGESVIFTPEFNTPIQTTMGAPNNLAPGFRAGRGFYHDNADYDQPDSPASTADAYSPLDALAGEPVIASVAGINSTFAALEWSTNASFPDDNSGTIQQVNGVHNWGIHYAYPYRSFAFQAHIDPPSLAATDMFAYWIGKGSDPSEILAQGYRYSLNFSNAQFDNPLYSTSTWREAWRDSNLPWLRGFNPRAPFSGRNPFEYGVSGTGTGRVANIGNWESLTFRNNWGPANFLDDFALQITGTGGTPVGYSHDEFNIDTAVLYRIPEDLESITSIGDFMHVNITPGYQVFDQGGDLTYYPTMKQLQSSGFKIDYNYYNWNPAYVIGNSYAPLYLNQSLLYQSWPDYGISPSYPGRIFDYSYLANEALFDDFFFSTEADSVARGEFKNLRVQQIDPESALSDDPLERAENLWMTGGVNVNSTNLEVWEGLLASFYGLSGNPTKSVFTRSERLDLSDDFQPQSERVDNQDAFLGVRALSDLEIRSLARSIVRNIKERIEDTGPFVSLADFVNRSLSTDPVLDPKFKRAGVLQNAVNENLALNSAYWNAGETADDLLGWTNPLVFGGNGDWTYVGFDESAGIAANAVVNENLDNSTADFTLGSLTQMDLLSRIGPLLRVRSDTFVIRAYGESKNAATGEIRSKAVVEAVIQRYPEFVDSSSNPPETPFNDTRALNYGLSPLSAQNKEFGRKYRIISTRWLDSSEI